MGNGYPVAPPRAKHRRQTVQEFRQANKKHKEKELFQSEHRTEDGRDLLPVKKTIAFDCPFNVMGEMDELGAKPVNSADDILVLIEGPEGKKCPVQLDLNRSKDEFTAQFSTSTVGEHTIEIIIGEKRMDNVTSKFYTYDASKINVGAIPPGFVGMPVEFESKSLSPQLDPVFVFDNFETRSPQKCHFIDSQHKTKSFHPKVQFFFLKEKRPF